MEYLIAFICLCSLPVYFGYRHFLEYWESSLSKENFSLVSWVALILLFSYFGLVIYMGIDELYELKEAGRESRKFITFFIYPSVGFGLAIFPKIASEYIFNAFSMNMLRIQNQLCSFMGWLLIFYLVFVLVL